MRCQGQHGLPLQSHRPFCVASDNSDFRYKIMDYYVFPWTKLSSALRSVALPGATLSSAVVTSEKNVGKLLSMKHYEIVAIKRKYFLSIWCWYMGLSYAVHNSFHDPIFNIRQYIWQTCMDFVSMTSHLLTSDSMIIKGCLVQQNVPCAN